MDPSSEVTCVVDAACELAEGPHWHRAEGALYWVDINGRRIHRWRPGPLGEHSAWDLPVMPTALAQIGDSRRFRVATDAGLGLFDAQTGAFELGEAIEADRPQNRSNDGKVGPDKHFWVGSMHRSAAERSGALYRIGHEGIADRVLDGIGISNTVAWSPDGELMYFADSLRSVIWRMPFEPTTGAVGERELFVELTDGASPDGSATDVDGCLWNAQWDGARVVRYAPDGRIDRVITLPVSRPTSCAFGGPDGKTLYITSAREGLDATQVARQPLAGGVFAIDVGVAGCAVPSLDR